MSIRTMLVEDEWLIREALLRTVPWEQYGFEIAGQASNGRDALEMFIQLQPDVVITDIRMPGMDGLELIGCIREISPTVLICILSSHTDFGLARQGIRYGVFEYLDKLNLSSGEVEHCLERLYDTFHKKLSEQRGGTSLLVASRPEVRILELQSPSAWLKQFRLSARECAGWRWIIMLIDREIWGQTDIHAWLEWFPYPAVIAERRLFVDTEQRLHLILEDEIEAPHLLLERYEDTGILISSRVAGPNEWEKAYREAEELQADLFYTGWNHMVDYEHKRIYQMSVTVLQAEQEENLIALLAGGNANAIMDCLDQLMQDAERRSVHPKRLVQALTMLLTRNIPGRYFHREHIAAWGETISLAHSCTTARQFMERMSAALRTVMQDNERSVTIDVELAIRYVQQHYPEKITLGRLAGAVHLNPNYFSTLFKEQTGETPMSFVAGFRVEKAKELLRRREGSIQEIAEQVGLHNLSHFSRVFKKMTGKTPSEYRGDL
ncbi:helix-turn-helix domain-containing protein [Paenibacillus sp. FSL R5-0517]|uniref:helix-turn-helix domain-containing protein n=1 Tax=Paenibacillus sp. FSL R5-0517 TaxID=2921647 RepID=UPI0030D706A9